MESPDILHQVLNENNEYINETIINNLFKKYNINHKVKNLHNFQLAMTHKTYIESCLTDDRNIKVITKNDISRIDPKYIKKVVPLQKESYERLEFLGDSITHAIIALYLFQRYPTEQEGFMTRLRTKIENGIVFSELSKMLCLQKYILLDRNLEQLNSRVTNLAILEDTFEAFIGALSLEASFELCYDFVVKLIQENIDLANIIYEETNYKDTMLQYYHKMKWHDPEYGVKSITEIDASKKIYTMFVKGYVPSLNNSELVWDVVATGSGQNKKQGEQEAAKNALQLYGALKAKEDIIEVYQEEINYD